MATSRSLATDPLRNFKFQVIISGTTPVPTSIGTLGFMTADGFGIQNEVIPYREGGDNTTAIPLDSPVLTTLGWKLMGEIEIGDHVIDPRGEDSKVIDILPAGTKSVYRITLGDGSQAIACHGHLWEFQTRDTNNRKKVEIDSTLHMKSQVERKGYQVLLPKCSPMNFDVAPELPLDPYLLGILLSEGSLELEGVSFAQEEANAEVIERCRQALPAGCTLRPEYQDGVVHSWAITVGNSGAGPRNVNGRNAVLSAVRDLGLLGKRSWEKFIPDAYKWASIEDRLALLQGIMDGDGWVDERHCTSFASSSAALAADTRDLIYSLGGRCGPIRHQTNRSYRYKDSMRPARDSWEFSGISDLEFVPFTLGRKVERFACSEKTSSQFRRVRSVEYVGEEVVQCIEVSAPSHLFISDNWVISHNTRKMPGQTDYGPLTFGRGMMASPLQTGGGGAANISNGTSEIYTWLGQVFSAMEGQGSGRPLDNFRCNVLVNVFEHPTTNATSGAGISKLAVPPIKAQFAVFNAWPMGLNWSGMDAGGNAIIIETLQLAHEGFKVRYAGSTPGNYLTGTPF